ncbi:uncharacterized protein LOC110818321 isoform X1 [Carica papaya]|uniref:uncharacterized protein LOC110818320 isoform X3 n=1 Tax=Carica papaya TaxID=3649 RepID=UPI000B8D0295|nr:uncharacterized protein LOC110818320 isoform X3 [Carica papaya]XP_021902836.1 uncharacterized protein LOC110818321 isoform X1 [Carica papaya]
MDLTSPNYFQSPSLFSSNGDIQAPPFLLQGSPSFYGRSEGNPFAAENFPDPLCKLNLKETSEFVKSLPMPAVSNAVPAQRRRDGNSVTQRRMEAPSTPGRPVFSFNAGNLSRKSFPSKWDDAEKWVISNSCHDSPAHSIKPPPQSYKQYDSFKHRMEVVVAEKSRVTEEKVSKIVSTFRGSVTLDHRHHNPASTFNGVSASSDVLLKDKFTDEVEPVLPDYQYSEPSKEGFLFRNSARGAMKDAGTEVQHRDIGTEMTPLGSSTTSRCHTPFKSSSPARHNTPANRSGPLALTHPTSPNSTIDIAHFQECHLAKLQVGTQYDSITSNWSSREEEEEEISKSLRHFETGSGRRTSVSDSRLSTWVDEEKTKCCLRLFFSDTREKKQRSKLG